MVGLLSGGTTLTHYPVPDPEVASPLPLAPTALPIPVLLQTLLNEWDALACEERTLPYLTDTATLIQTSSNTINLPTWALHSTVSPAITHVPTSR